jgi:hypothetical protein
MRNFRRTVLVLCALGAAGLRSEPIKLNPVNPHYYLFNGKPTILITSAEHYGGVVNGEFDYIAYFDALKAYGMNYTRIYPGFLFEPMGKFMKGNTLGSKPSKLILPWARSDKPGYPLGGNLFDLDKWNPEFFTRLKDFVAKAGERGIVVEICFFNAQYGDTWPMSPLYFENNIQGEGKFDYEDAQTLKHADITRRESDYVRKVTEEVNGFDNVILEICDEPYLTGTPIELAGPWIGHMVEVIKDAENKLPKKHLIAQQIEGPMGGPCDYTAHPDVSVIVTQYVWEGSHEQMGGLMALDYEYDKNKPIDFNETDYYPGWYLGDRIGDSRVEAWEFVVGGGGSFNQLNGLYTVRDPGATRNEENAQLLRALQSLNKFMYSFDFLKMRPDRSFVIGGIPLGAFARGMSEAGKQYAFYHHHSAFGRSTASYKVTPGNYQEQLQVDLPPGTYQIEWVEPATGSVLDSKKVVHGGGRQSLTAPSHAIDVALRIKRS